MKQLDIACRLTRPMGGRTCRRRSQLALPLDDAATEQQSSLIAIAEPYTYAVSRRELQPTPFSEIRTRCVPAPAGSGGDGAAILFRRPEGADSGRPWRDHPSAEDTRPAGRTSRTSWHDGRTSCSDNPPLRGPSSATLAAGGGWPGGIDPCERVRADCGRRAGPIFNGGAVFEAPPRRWLEFLEGARFESSRQNLPEMTTFLKRCFSDTAHASAPMIR